MPPYHWWRTVFFLIPALAVYTIVLGTISLSSSFFDRSGRFAHSCARAWSWLILTTTGVTVDVRGLERLPRGTATSSPQSPSIYDIRSLFWKVPSSADPGQGVARRLHGSSLASRPQRTDRDRKNPGAARFRQVRSLRQAGYR